VSRKHGAAATSRRIMAEKAVVMAMFAARIHRAAREGGVVTMPTGEQFRAVRRGPYRTDLVPL
jgi:hypothetical protein